MRSLCCQVRSIGKRETTTVDVTIEPARNAATLEYLPSLRGANAQSRCDRRDCPARVYRQRHLKDSADAHRWLRFSHLLSPLRQGTRGTSSGRAVRGRSACVRTHPSRTRLWRHDRDRIEEAIQTKLVLEVAGGAPDRPGGRKEPRGARRGSNHAAFCGTPCVWAASPSAAPTRAGITSVATRPGCASPSLSSPPCSVATAEARLRPRPEPG